MKVNYPSIVNLDKAFRPQNETDAADFDSYLARIRKETRELCEKFVALAPAEWDASLHHLADGDMVHFGHYNLSVLDDTSSGNAILAMILWLQGSLDNLTLNEIPGDRRVIVKHHRSNISAMVYSCEVTAYSGCPYDIWLHNPRLSMGITVGYAVLDAVVQTLEYERAGRPAG